MWICVLSQEVPSEIEQHLLSAVRTLLQDAPIDLDQFWNMTLPAQHVSNEEVNFH
jgi:predicted naringenin-chalcone synthase